MAYRGAAASRERRGPGHFRALWRADGMRLAEQMQGWQAEQAVAGQSGMGRSLVGRGWAGWTGRSRLDIQMQARVMDRAEAGTRGGVKARAGREQGRQAERRRAYLAGRCGSTREAERTRRAAAERRLRWACGLVDQVGSQRWRCGQRWRRKGCSGTERATKSGRGLERTRQATMVDSSRARRGGVMVLGWDARRRRSTGRRGIGDPAQR